MSMEEKTGLRASWIMICVNLFLAIIKFLGGIFGHSMSLISDAIHSVADVFSTFIVIIGLKLSAKLEDKEHPYGHERFESLASLFLAIILLITGLSIGAQGFEKLLSLSTVKIPTSLALIIVIISILAKESMFWVTKRAALKINSNSLLAEAWHQRSDALSSIGSLIGIIGTMLGIAWCDPLASIVICLIVLKTAWNIGKEAVNELLDTSCSQGTEVQIRNLILSIPEVNSLDSLKTRLFGNKIYVDVEIGINKNFSLEEAHEIAHLVQENIGKVFKEVKNCMVHVNPTL